MHWAQCSGAVTWVCWNVDPSRACVSSVHQALAGVWWQTDRWQCWITHCSHRPTQAVSVLSTEMKVKCFCLHGTSTAFPKKASVKVQQLQWSFDTNFWYFGLLSGNSRNAVFQFPSFQPTWKTGALSREIGLVVPISQSEALCLAWFLASRGLRLVALVMMMTAKLRILFSQILQWYCWLFSWDAKSAPLLEV